MFDVIGARFFAALARAAENHVDAGDPCIAALRHAGSRPDPAATVAAQEALDLLAPAVLNAIMSDAHRLLREDPAALLDAWRPGDPKH